MSTLYTPRERERTEVSSGKHLKCSSTCTASIHARIRVHVYLHVYVCVWRRAERSSSSLGLFMPWEMWRHVCLGGTSRSLSSPQGAGRVWAGRDRRARAASVGREKKGRQETKKNSQPWIRSLRLFLFLLEFDTRGGQEEGFLRSSAPEA